MKRLLLIAFLLTSHPLYAATTVRSSSTNTAGTGTALSVSAPAGTTTGDLVFVFISSNGTITHTDNNGSTPFTEDLNDYQGSTSGTLSIWERRILAGDPSTYNFTIGATTRWTIHAITLQSPNTTGIYDGTISTNGSVTTVTTANANSITTGVANSLHFALLTDDGASNTITSTPAGYTCPQNSGQQTMAVCYKVIASPSATGTQSFSWTSASEWNSASFAVLDVGGGGGGGATIAFDAATDGLNNGGSTNSLTFTHSSSGSNRIGWVVFAGDNVGGADDITSVTWGGTACALAVKYTGAYSRYMYVYYITGQATGSQTIIITASSNHYILAVAASYTGVDQSSPIDVTTTNRSATSTDLTLTTSLTTTVNNDWILLMEDGYDGGAPPDPGAGATRRVYGAAFGEPGLFDSNGAITPAASYSMTTTFPSVPTGTGINHAMVAFKPNVTAPTGPKKGTVTLLGVGR